MVTYKEEDMKKVLTLLNQMDTRGIKNCEIIITIAQIINNPIGDDNGNKEV